MGAGGRVGQRAWDGRGGDEGGGTEGSGEQASEGRASRAGAGAGAGVGVGADGGVCTSRRWGRRTCNKGKQDSESIKTEKRRRVGDGATGPWAGERAREAVVGSDGDGSDVPSLPK
jgi:hypothetical protein